MKKLLFLLLLFHTSDLWAQKFRAGLAAGFNATQVDGDKLSGYNKLGANAGLFVYYPLTDKWRVQAEFLYSGKGARQVIDDNNAGDPTTFVKLSCHYIEVPFILGYRYRRFNFQGGLSGAYLFSARREDFNRVSTVTSDLKKGEFAYLLRAEYRLSESFSVNGGFSYSLSCISKRGCDPLWVNPKLRQGFHHNMLTFTLRYLLKEG